MVVIAHKVAHGLVLNICASIPAVAAVKDRPALHIVIEYLGIRIVSHNIGLGKAFKAGIV